MMGKDIERILSNVNDMNNIVLDRYLDVYTLPSEKIYTIPFKNTYDLLKEDYEKMKHIDELNFADKCNFNNSIGSPWTEFNSMMKVATLYLGFISTDSYKEMIPILMTQILDFKCALITYHDYVQRAFDNVYNDNEPSITFTNDSRGTQSTGNVSQKISNNVSVKDVDITPY